MKKTFKIAGKNVTVRETMLDRVVNYFNPVKGAERLHSRAQRSMFEAISGGYSGASKSRRSLSEYTPKTLDADSAILPDLPTLRSRCDDLARNNPIALGAINTNVTNVVGTGLTLQSNIDWRVLNISEEEADALQVQIENEWALFSESKDCDITRTLDFGGIQELAFRSMLTKGDVFAVLPYQKQTQDFPFGFRIQLVEAERICNENNARDTKELSGGVEKDVNGAPVAYHIARTHPGNTLYTKVTEWDRIPAFNPRTGLRNIIHLYDMQRIGQTRGVPYLSAIIEPLKQLGRMTEAELTAAVIAACFTAFIKTESGDPALSPMAPTSEVGGATSDEDYKLAPGAIIDLRPGEDITTATPGRPNPVFDTFCQAIFRQIGMALEMPYEILIKHYTASYSAARAAMLDAWKVFLKRRKLLAENFCQVVFENWMYEQVASERIAAPGYFDDPIIRKAYHGTTWVGPTRGMIDETKEVDAAKGRINISMTTIAEETAALTGTDWESKLPQIRKERQILKELGFVQVQNEKKGTANQNENMKEMGEQNLMEE
ncbi:MAG: phage portal protein [Candidatus Kuenenia sp.]|nr:phage portal protein [Candidatus Kuenenia hertensis]